MFPDGFFYQQRFTVPVHSVRFVTDRAKEKASATPVRKSNFIYFLSGSCMLPESGLFSPFLSLVRLMTY
jgi:hypothetical protein